MPSVEGGWSVLFLPAPSPGQVIRYLERRRRRAEDAVPDGLLLSDRAGPKQLRALVGPADTCDWMRTAASPFAVALLGTVTHWWRSDEQQLWGWSVWNTDGSEAQSETELPLAAPRGLLARLTGILRSSSPDIVWARQRGLPWERVPAAKIKAVVPLIDYATVARLDQKSLLVEDSPRLYRFDLPLPPAPMERRTP